MGLPRDITELLRDQAFNVRFWSRVAVGEPFECWPWEGPRYPNEYGRSSWRSRQSGAHRFAYVLANRRHPGTLDVLHRCDNPPCCNPSHLVLGTISENVRDAVAKNRWPQGQRHRGRPSNQRIVSDELLREAAGVPRGQLKDFAKQHGLKYSTLQVAVWKAVHGVQRHV